MSAEKQPQCRKCEQCGKREATVHLTLMVGGKATQRRLCEECYNEQEGVPPLSAPKFLTQLVAIVAPELQELQSKECDACGINYLEFRQGLKFGCPRDYEVFAPALDQLLERIHGSNRHLGKVPRGVAQEAARGPKLAVLRRELGHAVKTEDYESAARLRDEIRELEQGGVGDPEQ